MRGSKIENLQTAENREDGSNFDDFRTKKIGPKRSQRPKLIHEKFSKEQNEQKVFKKFEFLKKVSNIFFRMIFGSLYYRPRFLQTPLYVSKESDTNDVYH